MGQRRAEDSSKFPYGVALASLAIGLTLFFANTVPALREQHGLAEIEAELGDLRRQYEDAIQQTALSGGNRLDYDLQSLLVAIDQQGFTPLELCVAYPQHAAANNRAADSAADSAETSGAAAIGERAGDQR